MLLKIYTDLYSYQQYEYLFPRTLPTYSERKLFFLPMWSDSSVNARQSSYVIKCSLTFFHTCKSFVLFSCQLSVFFALHSTKVIGSFILIIYWKSLYTVEVISLYLIWIPPFFLSIYVCVCYILFFLSTVPWDKPMQLRCSDPFHSILVPHSSRISSLILTRDESGSLTVKAQIKTINGEISVLI